ncbi:MAG: ABC transporter ATP-binding protein [Oscillospiraceae bacterium]|nr:ABC transporter ATP-binding protein [Oscillospiraceae bacterium]
MNALEIKNLSKEYPGFKLNKISFTLPGGCILGLIGENGAGKSTTIKLILNMLRKDGGSITVLGRDSGADNRLTKEEVGVVLDEAGIPGCLNARQVGNIMRNTFKNWNASDYNGYLKRFALPLDKEYKDFSRGMKMKLSIAIAMSHNAKLLLLDEATSGLDPVVRDEVLDILNEFTRDENHSILMSSHIVSDLEKLCDYIAFLHKGRLMLFEEKDELLARYGILHCTEGQLSALSKDAIKHKKISAYGAEALVIRDKIPSAMSISPVSIEELFVYMVKEEAV